MKVVVRHHCSRRDPSGREGWWGEEAWLVPDSQSAITSVSGRAMQAMLWGGEVPRLVPVIPDFCEARGYLFK